MHESQPSRTAYRVAVRRAAHQVVDQPPVFVDPLALRILRREDADRIQTDRAWADGHRFDRALRAFLAVRSRFAEDELAAAVARGVPQFVLLGAGLDTFAYRNPFADLRVFEVDHPATQTWKRERLAEGAIAIPSNVTFVSVDFESQTVSRELEAAGFDASAPAFFSWLGVTTYLTRESIRSTLRFVVTATSEAGGIVFDYATDPAALPLVARLTFDAMSRRVNAAGEPWQTFLEPFDLANELRTLGFTEIRDLGPEAINATYFAGRSDGLRVGSLGHVILAR
ncbi:MAG TPA: class I SAM-dependent methyltransferase [Vicinamibacterales bacterium]|jgi:methyltransferase (TIGR00027 family)|nr:class I SAM-dependent methyltransferase [Vicinamibacterales bacterium]